MNVADSEVVASVMQMAGYETVENIDEADAVFLNTCSVRENAENKIYHRLEALHNINKNIHSLNFTFPTILIHYIYLLFHNSNSNYTITTFNRFSFPSAPPLPFRLFFVI